MPIHSNPFAPQAPAPAQPSVGASSPQLFANPVHQNPFSSSTTVRPQVSQLPLEQPNFFASAFDTLKNGALTVLGAVGTVARPFSAPQQVLFGALRGDPVRGLKSAANDLTSWFANPFADTERISGEELIKAAQDSLSIKGVPESVARIGGIALDLALDPALLLSGGASAASKASRAAVLAGDVRKVDTFATAARGLGMASDFVGNPLKVAFQAVPKTAREVVAQGAYQNFFGRALGATKENPLGSGTVGDFILPKEIQKRVYPQVQSDFIAAQEQARAVGRAGGNLIADRLKGLETAYDAVLAPVPAAGRALFQEKLNQFVTFTDAQDAQKTWSDLLGLAATHGVDEVQLWHAFQQTTRVNTFSSGIMAGVNQQMNAIMKSRLGVSDADIAAQARLSPETIRQNLAIPEASSSVVASASPQYQQFQQIASQEAQNVLGIAPTVSDAELAARLPRRGLHREVALYGADGQAHINRIEALARPAMVDTQQLGAVVQKALMPSATASTPYAFNYLNTTQDVGGTVMYHGTQAPINNLLTGNPIDYSSVKNLYGTGLYLTDNPNVARGYALGKGGQNQGQVFRVALEPGVHNLIDLEKPLPPDALQLYATRIAHLDGDATSVPAYIQQLATLPGKDVVDELKDSMRNAGLSNTEALSEYNDLQDALAAGMGYTGFRHTGGQFQGKSYGDHNVAILFSDTSAQGKRLNQLARENAPVPITAVPDSQQVIHTLTNELTQPGVRMIDALQNVRQAHNLNADQMQEITQGIISTGAFTPSSQDLAVTLRNLRASAQKPGARLPGSGAAGASKTRLDLTEQQLSDLGEVRDVLTNAYQESKIVSKEVAFQAKALATKKFLTDNNLYVKPDQLLPQGASINASGGWAPPGWSTVTDEMSKVSGGALETGAVIPDFVARDVMIATKAGGEAGSSVLQRAMSRWQVVKLSNAPTIVQNVISNIVQMGSYAPAPLSPADLAYGLLQRSRETPAMKEARLASGLGSWSEDMMGISRTVANTRTAMAGGKPSLGENLQGFFDDLIGAHNTGASGIAGKLNPGRQLFTLYKATEDRMRDAAWYAMQKVHGMDAATAADHATNILFDYSARPAIVDAMSKLGIPFQTYGNLAAWRTVSTLYDHPSFIANQVNAQQNVAKDVNDPKELNVAGDWITKAMPVKIGTDSQGRGLYVPTANWLPMGAASAIADNWNASMFGPVPVPPLAGLLMAAFGGTGFRGQPIYKGLGDSNVGTAFGIDPAETTRRFLGQLWQFGAYPWAPGTPMADRLTKAIVKSGAPLEHYDQQLGLSPGTLARLGSNGPLLWSEGALNVNGDPMKKEAPSDVLPALGRVLGLRSYEVQSNPDVPGAARNAAIGAKAELNARLKYWKNLYANASPADQPGIEARAMKDMEERQAKVQALFDSIFGK